MKKLTTSVLALALLLAACGSHQIKPLAPGAKPCGNDWECPAGSHCGFPGVDTYAQCLPGGSGKWQMGDPKVNVTPRLP
jgi:hypothetical protein